MLKGTERVKPAFTSRLARTLCLCASLLAAGVAGADTASLKAKGAAKVEQMAMAMLPQEKMNKAMGFFAPVTKKYLPVFQRFNDEYLASTNRIAVVKKYLPKADAALAEAKAMKVPAKYEAEKAEYIRTAEAFLMMTKLTVRLGE